MKMSGDGGNHSLNFDGVASRSVGIAVEPKVCESCTRQFFRVVMFSPQLREKFCPACRARRAKLAAGVQA